MTRTEQKAEAVLRMKMLRLHSNAQHEFVYEDKINVSHNGMGILFWADEEEQALIKAFEEKHNAVVYHAIRSHTEFGELLSLLYVSQNEEEWKFDRADLKGGYPIAYVANITDEWCSELGYIGVAPMFGGVKRTA